jgi:hypothetical protein
LQKISLLIGLFQCPELKVWVFEKHIGHNGRLGELPSLKKWNSSTKITLKLLQINKSMEIPVL